MVEILICSQVTLDDLVEQIDASDWNYEDIIKFIKDLDDMMCDWGATEQLYEYFVEQHEIHKKDYEADREHDELDDNNGKI